MRFFTDSKGNKWELALNLGVQLRLKAEFQHDIRDVHILEKLGDAQVFTDIIGCLLAKQIEAAQLTRDTFFESLIGNDIDALAEELIQEIVDFFPERQKPIVRELLAKAEKYRTSMKEVASEAVTNPKMDQLIETTIQKEREKLTSLLDGTTIANSSGALPASSA